MCAEINRREFVSRSAAAAGGGLVATAVSLGAKIPEVPRKSIVNFNESMEYRRLGKTGMMVSAVCMGGHWKRVGTMLGPFHGEGFSKEDYENVRNPAFLKNRHDVVSRCIDVGINYIDACAGPEVLAYSKVLKGRRNKMQLGFSWFEREARFAEWRTGKKLLEGLDMSLKETGLDYVDVWRITLPAENMPDLSELTRIEEAVVEALARAKKQGKARFTGVSTHNRVWLKSVIETYPKQMEVTLFPYTPRTKELPTDSLFAALRKQDVGAFGIKPFGSNSLFQGDSSQNNPHQKEDDERARLAIRWVLGNPAITAPIPGMINTHQVDNVARAVMEQRKLNVKEKARLDEACDQMWARLPDNYQWLKDWEYV
jgi:aryl-alcohol dehydrogenase-like predicted oxidoreductase